jgi:hypothetical protein
MREEEEEGEEPLLVTRGALATEHTILVFITIVCVESCMKAMCQQVNPSSSCS